MAKMSCMVAGSENKAPNPAWNECTDCCSFCKKKCPYEKSKCERKVFTFCGWRTETENMPWISVFGEKYAEELYKENIKKREKMVSDTAPSPPNSSRT